MRTVLGIPPDPRSESLYGPWTGFYYSTTSVEQRLDVFTLFAVP